MREHVATYAQAHGRALDVWQREWAARKLAAARARRASCPALPLPSLCRSQTAPVPVVGQPATATSRSSPLTGGVPLTAAFPVSRSPELVLLSPAACHEPACGEDSEVDTVFLDHVLDFLKSEEDPLSSADSSGISSSSDSSSSSSESSVGEETPSSAARAGRAPSRSTRKLTASQVKSKHSARRPQPRKPRVQYPHRAVELLLVVPPGVPSAVMHPVAPPEASKQTPTGKGKVRTGAQKKLRAAAEAKRQEKAKEAGDLCCPVCADVGTQKLFKGVPGFVGHLNSHIAHDVPVPDLFWASQSVAAVCVDRFLATQAIGYRLCAEPVGS